MVEHVRRFGLNSDSTQNQQTPRPDPSTPNGDGAKLLQPNFGKPRVLGSRLFLLIGAGVGVFFLGFIIVNVLIPLFWPSGSATQVAASGDNSGYAVHVRPDGSSDRLARYRVHSNTVLQPTTHVAHVTAEATIPPAGDPTQGVDPRSFVTKPQAQFNAQIPGVPLGTGLLTRPARIEVDNADAPAATAAGDQAAGEPTAPPIVTTAAQQIAGAAAGLSQAQVAQVQPTGAQSAPSSNVYLNETVQSPRTQCTLTQGDHISGIFAGAVDSQFPGDPMLIVTKPIWSHDQSCLMAPQNSRLRLKYVNVTQTGQNRMYIIATRLIFPNGKWIRLNNFDVDSQDGSAGVNAYGRSNTLGLIGQTLLLSGFQAVFNKISNSTAISQVSIGGATGSGGSGLNDLISTLVKTGTSQAPELRIDVGTEVDIDVALDMEMTGPYEPRTL
jgi:type IV secretory pathway VirB10-like protein